MSEKVKVPAWFDKWYRSVGSNGWSNNRQENSVFKIARQGYGYDFYDDIDDCEVNQIDVNKVDREYVKQHKLELIKAVIDGYEVEEPKYRVKIGPHQYIAFTRTTGEILSFSPEQLSQLKVTNGDWVSEFTPDDYANARLLDSAWWSFLPKFDPNDPHFEKVRDEDE